MFIRKKELEEIQKRIGKLEWMIGSEKEPSVDADAITETLGLSARCFFRETLQEKVDRLDEEIDALANYFDVSIKEVHAHKECKRNEKKEK